MLSQTGCHSRGGIQTGMDGTEIVDRTSPKQVGLNAPGRSSQVASAANQRWHAGPESGIEPLNVGGVDQTKTSLSHGNQIIKAIEAAVSQTTGNLTEFIATALFDHLDDVQIRPRQQWGTTWFARKSIESASA